MNKFIISFIFCYFYAVTVLGIFVESSKDLNQCSSYNETGKKSISFEAFFILCILFLVVSLFGIPFLYNREVSVWYCCILFSSITSCVLSIFNFLTLFNKIYDLSKCTIQIKVLNILLCFYIFISEVFVLLYLIYCIYLLFRRVISLINHVIRKPIQKLSYFKFETNNRHSLRNENL